jgi:hypothetical protein
MCHREGHLIYYKLITKNSNANTKKDTIHKRVAGNRVRSEVDRKKREIKLS